MADNKRGGRSSDDEFDEDENDERGELDDSDDDADLDPDLEADDDEANGDDRKAAARTGSKSVAARTGGARTASRDRKRDDSRPGFFGRIVRFIREVVAEMQKVIYPTRKELLTYTSVVLVFVIVVMTVVSLMDLGFARLMFLVFGSETTT